MSVAPSHSRDRNDLAWVPRASPPHLDRGSIHLWHIALDLVSDSRARLEAVLSNDERERASAMTSPGARLRFVATRGALRIILGGYLEVAPESLAFTLRPWGKPVLGGASAGAIRFNVAHAGSHAVVAVAWDREVGVDIECKRPISHPERLARRILAPSERQTFRATPPAEQTDHLLGFWTRKEALAKACGLGIFRSHLRSTDLGPLPRDSRWRTIHSPGHNTPWSLRSFDLPAPDCIGAICIEGCGAELAAFRWRW